MTNSVTVADLQPGVLLSGVRPGLVTVVAATPLGESVNLVFRDGAGEYGDRLLYPADLAALAIQAPQSRWSFDADGAEFRPGRPAASAVRLRPMAAGLTFAAIVATAAAAAIFSVFSSHGHDGPRPFLGRSAPSLAPKDGAATNDWTPAIRPAPQGADLQGFLGYPAARCNSANPAVAVGRTTKSLLVICQNYAGRFYYKALGFQHNVPVEVDNSVRIGNRLIASTNGVKYLVSAGALIITWGPTTVGDEPMLEYWSV